MGLIPGSRRSPGGGNGNLFQYSWLENPMDRGTWRTTVHGVAKSQPWLKQLITHTHTHTGPYYCPVEPCSCLIYHCWMNFYLFEQQIPLTLWSLWASFQNDIFLHMYTILYVSVGNNAMCPANTGDFSDDRTLRTAYPAVVCCPQSHSQPRSALCFS